MIRIRLDTPVAAAERLARRLGCRIVVRAGVAYLTRDQEEAWQRSRPTTSP